MGTAGQHFFHEQKTRLLALLIAAVICCIGFRTPLPGMPESMLRFSPFSVLYYWLWPWVMIAVIGEMLRLFLGRWFAPELLADGHVDPFSRWVILATLLYATMHAIAFSNALDGQLGPDDMQGAVPKLTIVATLVAGLALSILLARWLQSGGAAPGFWAAIGLSFMISWAENIARVPELLLTAQITGSFVLKNALWLVLWTAAIAGIVAMRETNGETDGQRLRWVWLLPFYAADWIIAAVEYMAPASWAIAIKYNRGAALEVSQITVFLAFAWICLLNDRSPRIRHTTLMGFGLVLTVGAFMPAADGLYLQPDGLLILMLAQFALFLRAQLRVSQHAALLAKPLRSASALAASKAGFPPARE
jgi:hypothetical protein